MVVLVCWSVSPPLILGPDWNIDHTGLQSVLILERCCSSLQALKTPQYPLLVGVNESLVIIWVCMRQNREACSYPLYPSVSAGTAGMLSPLSAHAVFIATKNRGMCKYKRSWPCMRFVVKGDAWSEIWHNFAYISDSKDGRWGTRIQHYKQCGRTMVWNDSHFWSLKGLWSPIPPIPSKLGSK